MSELLAFLNFVGIHLNVNESSSPIALFCVVVLVFAVISLLCVVNIIIYLVVKYISETKVLLDKISKHVLLFKLFKLYKKTRLFYIVIDFVLLLVNIGSIIWLCLRLINGLSQ